MFRKMIVVLLASVVVIGLCQPAAAEMKQRVGLGVHYYEKLGDIEYSQVEEDGLGWMLTYQWRSGALLALEADVELLPEGFGGLEKEVLAPKAYVIVGAWIYGAVGVGIYYSDGEFADDPFYALRAGVDLPVLPFLYVDVNVEYRFEEWNTLEGQDIDEDTLELGIAGRIQF